MIFIYLRAKFIFVRKTIFSLLVITLFSCGSNDTDVLEVENNQNEINTYLVNISTSDGGTVNVSSGNYDEGTVLNITATEQEGFRFIGWQGFDSTDASITINVNQAYNLVAQFLPVEEAPINQNTFSDNVNIDGATKYQGEITPNSNISFQIENRESILATVETGFNIDLTVPESAEGAYVQFKSQNGDTAESFFGVPISSSDKLSSKRKSRSKRKLDRNNKKTSGIDFSFNINFNEISDAGIICVNIYLYDSASSVSYPVEVCVTINNFGGGPPDLAGRWRYLSWEEHYTSSNGEAYVESEEFELRECEDSYECTYYEGNNLLYSGSMSEFCWDKDSILTFNEDGTYLDQFIDNYEECPVVNGSLSQCIEAKYGNFSDWEIYLLNCEPTTTIEQYTGKWAYDDNSNTIGLFDYTYQVIDDSGFLDEPLETFSTPEPYFDNGTIVEINGDILTLTEYYSYNDGYYVVTFGRIVD